MISCRVSHMLLLVFLAAAVGGIVVWRVLVRREPSSTTAPTVAPTLQPTTASPTLAPTFMPTIGKFSLPTKQSLFIKPLQTNLTCCFFLDRPLATVRSNNCGCESDLVGKRQHFSSGDCRSQKQRGRRKWGACHRKLR